ncbi:MAG: T9SS type A sorting domain-containing protein [Balneola sp.]
MKNEVILLIFLFLSNPLFGQVSSETTTDKEQYEVGETIILKAIFYNDTDAIHTYRGSSSNIVRLIFSGINLFGDAITTDDYRDTLFIGDKRELIWELDTSLLFLPKKSGEQTIIVDYLGIIDSVSFQGKQYPGGNFDVYFENSVDTTTIRSMADSLNAKVIELRKSYSKWGFSDIQIDSLAETLIKDPKVLDIEIPSRKFISPTSLIATSNENETIQNYNFRLFQNYPNPFNPTTTFTFELSQPGKVRLSIFNMIGQEVAVLQNNRLSAGSHSVNFDGSNLASGTYFYRLKTADGVLTKKFTLIK